MRNYLGACLLGIALLAPVTVKAGDEPRRTDSDRNHSYYDSAHRDRHEWNEREDTAYRRWVQEHHREYRDFPRLNRRDQQQYWNWRHSHSDDDRDRR